MNTQEKYKILVESLDFHEDKIKILEEQAVDLLASLSHPIKEDLESNFNKTFP